MLGERAHTVFLRGLETWEAVVKEACNVESSERLLSIGAHAAIEARRSLLPVNAPRGLGCGGTGKAALVDLPARVGSSHGIEAPRRALGLIGAGCNGGNGHGSRVNAAPEVMGKRDGGSRNAAREGLPRPGTSL